MVKVNNTNLIKIYYGNIPLSNVFVNGFTLLSSLELQPFLKFTWQPINLDLLQFEQLGGSDKQYVDVSKPYFSSSNFANIVDNGNRSYTITATSRYQTGYIKPSHFGVFSSNVYMNAHEPYLIEYDITSLNGSFYTKNTMFKNNNNFLIDKNMHIKQIILSLNPTSYSLSHQITCDSSSGSFTISNLSIKKLSDATKTNYINTEWTPPYNESWTIRAMLNVKKNLYFESVSGLKDTDNKYIFIGQYSGNTRTLMVSVKSNSTPTLTEQMGIGLNEVFLSYEHLTGNVNCFIDGTDIKLNPVLTTDINTNSFSNYLNSGNPLPFQINSINNSENNTPEDTIIDFKVYDGILEANTIRSLIASNKTYIKVAMLSDSLSRPEYGFYKTMGSYLKANTHILTTGWGGATTISYEDLGKLDIALSMKADFNFIQFGTNDSGSANISDAVFEAQIRKFISLGYQNNSKPILCTPPQPVGLTSYWSSENIINQTINMIIRLKQYSTIIRNIGTELGIPVIDLNAKTEARYQNDGKTIVTSNYFTDPVHFKELGSEVIGELIQQEINRLVSTGFDSNSDIDLTKIQKI